MKNELQNELNKLYKLTGIKLNIENEDEVDISDLKKLSIAYKEKYSGDDLLFNILTGAYPYKEQANAIKSLNIRPEANMSLYLIHIPTKIDDSIVKIITSLYPGKYSEFICMTDDAHLCFLHIGDDNIVRSLSDAVETEGMISAYIAYSDIFSDAQRIPQKFYELNRALTISMIFYADKKIISPNRLGMGELIYNIPKNVCEKFLRNYISAGIDEDSMQLANTFFRHGLSIAETSRYMHMHRNTLVYRLEQIEKKYGIDIKSFEGAAIFNIAILITNFIKVNNNE